MEIAALRHFGDEEFKCVYHIEGKRPKADGVALIVRGKGGHARVVPLKLEEGETQRVFFVVYANDRGNPVARVTIDRLASELKKKSPEAK